MRFLKYLGYALATLVVAAAIAYLLRSDPIGPIAGKALSGPVASASLDASSCDGHMLTAIESRPDDPHSVTTLCFVMHDHIYVPAANGSEKAWPQYVLDDSRVRLKVGEQIFLAHAQRDTTTPRETVIAAISEKYAQMAERASDAPDDVWLFKLTPR
ncbi:MAG: hypothetical protein AAF513_20660 [Pseudomonadota bacterium]